jgi:mRNA interferase MazF
VVRGEVFRLRPARTARGREQKGPRYGVVVQANELLVISTVLVAPTSTTASPTLFRPAIRLEGGDTRVMVEHTAAVDLRRLGESVGRLDAAELVAVDEALTLVLGL